MSQAPPRSLDDSNRQQSLVNDKAMTNAQDNTYLSQGGYISGQNSFADRVAVQSLKDKSVKSGEKE